MERQTLRIENEIISKDFIGLSAVYHGFSHMPEHTGRGMSDYDREVEYSYVSDSNIKIARTMFLPNYNCENIYEEVDNTKKRMKAFAAWCGDMKKIGVEIAFQSAWHYSRNTYFGHDTPNAENDPAIFAKWLGETMSYLMDERGFDHIKYLFLFTEPTAYASGLIPEGYDIWSYYVKICKAIDAELRARNLRDRLKLVGPNNCSGGAHLEEAVRDLDDVIDVYTGHDYNHVNFLSWQSVNCGMINKVKSTGKPFWLDEYGMQLEIFRKTPEYGSYLAQIIATSIAAGHQTSFIWILLDQLYTVWPGQEDTEDLHAYNNDSFHNGVHRWGLVSWRHDTVENAGSPYPAWFAYKLISNAFSGNRNHGTAVTFKAVESMYVPIAAISDGSGYTIMAVNTSSEAQPIEIQLNTTDKHKFHRRIFDPSKLPDYATTAAPRILFSENGSLCDTLPASGFAVYTSRDKL